MKLQRSKHHAKAGFSLIEFVISMSILVMLTGALVEAMGSLRNLATASGEQASLQTMGDRTLLRVVEDLRSSGTVTFGLQSFPYVFDDGDPDALFPAHAHAPADNSAEAGDPDFGPNREIVFVVPSDADGDRRPDVDGNGELIWAAEEMSFVVVTRADGVNYLEQRTDGVAPRVYGHHVERVVFDNAESSGFQIPLNSVRVRLFFRRRDGQGNITRYRNEAVVALRNGQV